MEVEGKHPPEVRPGTPEEHRHFGSVLPTILVIAGPTASGKTELSIALARKIGGEIISADSRQIYRSLDVGTAKPTPEQRRRIPHHFIDERDPGQVFTAGDFGSEGRIVVREILNRGKVPIVVGGSGLYLRSLVDGLFEGPPADPELRRILETRVERGMTGELIEELMRVDPETALHADVTKPRRIIRALEVFYRTGKPLSHHHRENRPVIDFLPVMFGLAWDRKELYKRIEVRCDQMLRDGLVDEVRNLRDRGFGRSLNALNSVGYAEVFAFLEKETDYDEMVRLFKQNSRQFAKRQMTWFRNDGRIRWIGMRGDRSVDNVLSEIISTWEMETGRMQER